MQFYSWQTLSEADRNVSGNLFGDMYVTDPRWFCRKICSARYVGDRFTFQPPGWSATVTLPEFYLLLLSTFGMFWMISSRNLLMFYLSLELATIPLAAMVNFDLGKRISSEAAMKMVLSSVPWRPDYCCLASV